MRTSSGPHAARCWNGPRESGPAASPWLRRLHALSWITQATVAIITAREQLWAAHSVSTPSRLRFCSGVALTPLIVNVLELENPPRVLSSSLLPDAVEELAVARALGRGSRRGA